MEELLKELKITLKGLNLEHLARYVDDLYNSVEKTHIAFVGEYNAGKSSLINTLLGKKVVAERDLPTTNRVVLITHCPSEKKEKIDDYTEQICVNDERLKYLVLVDTPGLSSAIREHEDALLRYLHKADLIVIVAPSNQPYTKEIETLLNLLKDRHSTQWAYVINIFEDPSVYEEDPSKLQRLKEFVKEKLRGILSAEDVERTPIFAFSIRAVRKGLDIPVLTAEWEDFKRFIFEEVAEKAKQLKFQSLKEKLLKLLSGEEILSLQLKLEDYNRQKERWEEIRKRLEEFEKKTVSQRGEGIDRGLEKIFSELKKEVEELVAKYGSPFGQGNRFREEFERLINGHFATEEVYAELERLLDHRPELVKLRKLFPDVPIEPTIPPKMRAVKERFVGELKSLPRSVGIPGRVALWFIPLGVLLSVGGGFWAVKEKNTPWFGIALALLGVGLTVFSLYRVLASKSLLQKALEKRISNIEWYYRKLFKTYFEERFGEKLSKVYEYIDTRIGELEEKIRTLGGRLEKLERIKERLEKV